MLRIDESSKTLVAPDAAGFTPEPAPEPSELYHLVVAGWHAFAAEIGQPGLHLLSTAPEPGVDAVAFDEAAGRAAVVQVLGASPREQLSGALFAAAEVAGWDAQDLAEIHESLSAVVPGDSPRIILIAAEYDDQAVQTMDWLVRRHGLEITAYTVSTLRFGSERMLHVDRAYPASGESKADPAAAFFASVGATAPGASTPPPGVPASS